MTVERTTDIMEHGAQLTDRQLEELANDPMMAEECRDIFIAAGVLADGPVDTEQQLARFHKRHRRKHLYTLLYKVTASIAAVAACVAAIFIFIPKDEENGRLLFEAETGTRQPVLTDSQGTAMPLKMYVNDASPSDPIVVAKECNVAHLNMPARTNTVTLTLPKGQACRIDLADGTKVYLHPESMLNYPTSFGSGNRNVRLKGEAYFVVAKDEKCPFIVTTERTRTMVTGTEFNIKAYDNDKENVTLINGKIYFKGIGNDKAIEVKPGQQASIGNGGLPEICEADTMQYTAWRDGYHYYDEATVAEILRQISTSYNVGIECRNQRVLSYRMHYVVRRDITLAEAVRQLNRMGKLHARLTSAGKLIVE